MPEGKFAERVINPIAHVAVNVKTLAILVVLLTLQGQGKEFIVTAYCSCEKCCGKWSKVGKTAMGVRPKEGVTVAASRAIPFGTKLAIEGVGVRVVQDRLAKRFDGRVDVYFAGHRDAVKFGKKKLNITIK